MSKIKFDFSIQECQTLYWFKVNNINKYVNSINKIFNNNKDYTGFNVKSDDALIIISKFNERIPEDTEIVSFFVNNIPIPKYV